MGAVSCGTPSGCALVHLCVNSVQIVFTKYSKLLFLFNKFVHGRISANLSAHLGGANHRLSLFLYAFGEITYPVVTLVTTTNRSACEPV